MTAPAPLDPASRAGGRVGLDEIEALAARQSGVVTRVQLLRAGVSAALVDHRVRAKWLKVVHRGVYRVGPLTVPNTRLMAAVLAYGDRGVLAGGSAAALRELLPQSCGGEPIDVLVFRGRAPRREGIRARRTSTLLADEITVHEGIRVTTPARTLLDLAAWSAVREVERAVAEAMVKELVDRLALLEVVAQHPRHRGAGRLRRLLVGGEELALTRSEAEERLLALIRRARLGSPRVNVRVAGYEVDFLWEEERLVVEVDGRAFHGVGRRFESDRRRDAVLLAAGHRVMRVTWRQIMEEPEALLVRIAQALVRTGVA